MIEQQKEQMAAALNRAAGALQAHMPDKPSFEVHITRLTVGQVIAEIDVALAILAQQDTPVPEAGTSKEARGVYHKFRVERTDGKSAPGERHFGCEYFVLDTIHDPHAKPALLAYAESCAAKYPQLAEDARRMANGERLLTQPETPSPDAMEIVRFMQKRADEYGKLAGDRPGYELPWNERYYRNAGASNAIHNLANEVGFYFVNRTEPPPTTPETPAPERPEPLLPEDEQSGYVFGEQIERTPSPERTPCECREALEDWKRIIDFAEQRGIRMDLWPALLWERAVLSTVAALASPCHAHEKNGENG